MSDKPPPTTSSRLQGRIVESEGYGGGFSTGSKIFGLILGLAPALAIWRRAPLDLMPWIVGWIVLVSSVTFGLYVWDKRQARRNGWRISEPTLQFWALLGGWPGAFFGQRLLRHKSSKLSFLVIYWLIVGVHQFVAIDAILDWRMLRALRALMWDLRSQWF